MSEVLNTYGDDRLATISQHGVDIAVQRADDLDRAALDFLASLSGVKRALDVGSASGGQAIRMAEIGADVVAVDLDDYTESFFAMARARDIGDRCHFVRTNVVSFDVATQVGLFDAIVCQRMIHYLPFETAVGVVRNFHQALLPGGRLYISASGIYSELGHGYAATTAPLSARFAPLQGAMATKHAIQGSVCLYSHEDMIELLEEAGAEVVKVFVSEFGNVKAIAK